MLELLEIVAHAVVDSALRILVDLGGSVDAFQPPADMIF